MTIPISACLIARDETELLRSCLQALEEMDEIVVVLDERGGPETEEIARDYATRVERRVYEGDIQQRRHGVELAKNDWIFLVDPDEEVSFQLARSIRSAVEHASEGTAGFEISRVTFHLGRWILHGDFYPDWKLRVFRRSQSRWAGRNPHGRVEVLGASERIEGDLRHFSYRDFEDQVDRIQFFSAEAAAELRAEGRSARVRDIVLRPPARFLRAYLFKQGFRDGLPGFLIAAATAFHVMLKYAKLWELDRLAEREFAGESEGVGRRASTD